ncbi:hypothetical protein K7X08_009865 [Anisodus acutangulus]|uniref:Uncharacterized protein n=1 Tax=Anisodus acutangulus TaxID=402998 RepID=A0A9Q1N649_9SOLA|nr:hypothetical protein K7X08_009865 [Anisodus acutangulus]
MYSPNSITGKEVAGNGWQITTGEGERMFSKKNNKKQPLLSTESGANSSTVTVAIPPPRISVDCFRQRTYQQAAATTSSATFFSNG